MDFVKINWHKIKDLTDEEIKKIPKTPGIYFVRWSKNSCPVPISRITGIDRKGILYIGRSKNIRRRIKKLYNAVIKNKRGHTIFKTIVFCGISKVIKLDEYEIIWEELKTDKESEAQEWAAIKTYCDKYNEPPPLNLTISRELFAIFGIGVFGKSKFASEPDEFVRSVLL